MPEVFIQIWDREEVERWARLVEAAGLRPGSPVGFARWTSELARAFRSAGAALDFVDDDDGDAVFDILARLDRLRADADHLLARLGSVIADEVTVVRPSFDDVTVVRAQRRSV
jgi:hypothetical protein